MSDTSDDFFGIPISGSRRVLTMRINGALIRKCVGTNNLEQLAERIREIAPADVSLYRFGDGSIFFPAIPDCPNSSATVYEPGKRYCVSDGWYVGICSSEFEEVPDNGIIEHHDKEINL